MSSHTSSSNPCSFCRKHPKGQLCIKLLDQLIGGDSFSARKVNPEPEYVPITFKLYLSG